jgi:hypothetical protein
VALEPAPLPMTLPSTPTLLVATGRRSWLPWLAAGSVVLSLAVGSALGVYRHLHRSAPPPETSTAEVDAIDAMFSPQKREQVLQAAVEKNAYFGTDRIRMRVALASYLDLGLFYLEQWRLDDADRFFARLDSPQYPRSYRFLGRLGRATVLAFQDRPEESNRLFLELLGDKKADGDRAELALLQQQNHQLRFVLARALDHNAANATAETLFPSQLEYLRKPPLPLPRPRADKPPAKVG